MNSQADDDIGFGIYTDIADLPMTGCPSYIEEGIGGVCESGTATIVVFDVPFQIVPNVVITLMPWQLVFIKEISEDFRITFFKISNSEYIMETRFRVFAVHAQAYCINPGRGVDRSFFGVL